MNTDVKTPYAANIEPWSFENLSNTIEEAIQ